MTDPEFLAAMKVLSILSMAAQFTDLHLCCLQACRVVNLSVRYGVSGDSASAYGFWGSLLAFVFPRYREGYLFSKLACDLVEKHSFIANRSSILVRLGFVSGFTQPIENAIESSRRSISAGIETGSTVWAAYGLILSLTYRLLRGNPLDLVWHESEMAVEFAQKARYEDAVALFAVEQRFIATMRGGTVASSTFNDAEFDEAAFEAETTSRRAPIVMGRYWILKLMARLLSNDYADAWSAAKKAKPLLGAVMLMEPRLNYFYYAALAVAALYETAPAEQQQAWRELLGEHQEQLREWAENYPPTFADKLALVSAEIARIEKRDADGLRLYEEAIHSARENGFVQYEGLASELAARYYLAHRLETAGYAHLRNARNCYDRWGARGKVKQLEERYPRLREERTPGSTSVFGVQKGQLDIEAVVKASQAISSEMVLPQLIEKLLRIAVENAGAKRGLLILPRGGDLLIEAEAVTRPSGVEVTVREATVAPSDLPLSALNYAIRARQSVLLDDASADKAYAKDDYVKEKSSRSILCLPIVKQAKLVGALYLENDLTPGVFTPDRVTVLQLLASQAAISLENASLYSTAKEAEEKIRQAESELRQILDVAPQHVYVLRADPSATRIYANQAALDYFGLTFEEWRDYDLRKLFHPDDWERTSSGTQPQLADGLPHEVEIRLRRKDGKYRWFLSRRNPLRDEQGRLTRWYTAATDIEDRKAAEQKLEEENVTLREEIDKASMFEEIVGTSAQLKAVLSRISKVASTDSSVLITGETGTGKELAARAIHRRSQRSSHPFVSVNCAVIPRDLIASELFGHEKGAFTGATQHRLGRFEMAEKGTIFLDEVGELPADTDRAFAGPSGTRIRAHRRNWDHSRKRADYRRHQSRPGVRDRVG
jgi:PAS domain S-box-containing protein